MQAFHSFLPWQSAGASQWLGQRERFAHAWLLYGPPGIGKRQFALAAAASLLCESPVNSLACGHCPACQWVNGGNHPDLRRIRPQALAHEEGEAEGDTPDTDNDAGKSLSKEIRIEQIRTLATWFTTATHRGGWRVAVIYPAQAMNMVTANALLKVLEEPPEHTVFLLVADAPDRLLPTLVSRCRRLAVPVPGRDDSLRWLASNNVQAADAWLAFSGGAPLLAAQRAEQGDAPAPEWLGTLITRLAESPSANFAEVCDTLEKESPAVWIDYLQRLCVDLMLVSVGAGPRYFIQSTSLVCAIAARADAANLSGLAKWLAQQRAVAQHPLNARLFVYTALQRFVLACAPGAS